MFMKFVFVQPPHLGGRLRRLGLAIGSLAMSLGFATAQTPAIPEPPILLYGTVTDAATSQAVPITSIAWQVEDGTASATFSAASLPATRILSESGESFYLLEVPFETRVVQDGAAQVSLTSSGAAFELQDPSPTYTLTAIVNGQPATIKATEGAPEPAGTTAKTFNDYTPVTQGRMMRVDLFINEPIDPYAVWAATQGFPDPNAPEAQPGYDYDGDGFTNDQERLAGTNPTDRDSALLLADFSKPTAGDTFTLQWRSVSGITYQIQTTDSLLSNSWANIGDPVTATGSTACTSVPITPTDTRRFYRVTVVVE